ncbi:MAG: heme-binding protein [Proteobacteria bacterium]|nr:heme-binding protein [Pseudomonadota bacterium]
MIRPLPLALALLVAAPAAAQQIPGPYGPTVTLAQAERAIDAARAEAARRGFTMSFAVVDPAGELISFEKMDGTQNGSTEVALAKARSSARFRRPTKAWSDQVAAGRTAVLSLPGMIAIEGGLPMLANGRVMGALGVSGGTSEEDGQVAAVGLAALR